MWPLSKKTALSVVLIFSGSHAAASSVQSAEVLPSQTGSWAGDGAYALVDDSPENLLLRRGNVLLPDKGTKQHNETDSPVMMTAITDPVKTEHVVTTPRRAALHERNGNPLVRRVLDANDNLRAIGLGSQFDFPTIVVIGDQSAGKSSVLEAISGVQLLRGAGVVTRAPIELRLDGTGVADDECWARVSTSERTLYAESSITDGAKNTKKTKCSAVAAEINRTMAAMLASSEESDDDATKRLFASTPIRVRVTSSGLPDLTLVDLPGLARVATEGQSSDVPSLIRDLVASYVSAPNTIILAVVPCNADLATAEALKIAVEVDPDGERTVGVLTKPDLMDPGTETSVADILDGKVINLKEHGYFVVRNRGQRDIERKVELDAALRDEANFFQTHPLFKSIMTTSQSHASRFGAPALVKYLTKILVSKIAEELPSMRAKIDEKTHVESTKLRDLGFGGNGCSNQVYTPADRKAFLLGLTTDFAMSVRETTRGHYDMLARDSPEKSFMADLLKLYKNFAQAVETDAKPDVNSTAYDKRVREAVLTQHGRESFYGFPSYAIFTALVRDLVDKVFQPADKCASDVKTRVVRMARAASSDLFAARFPKLRRALDDIAKKLADERHQDAKHALDIFLNMQMQPFTQELLRKTPSSTSSSSRRSLKTTKRRKTRKHSNKGGVTQQQQQPGQTTFGGLGLEAGATRFADDDRGTGEAHLLGRPEPSSPQASVSGGDAASSSHSIPTETDAPDAPPTYANPLGLNEASRFFGRGSSTGESFRPQLKDARLPRKVAYQQRDVFFSQEEPSIVAPSTPPPPPSRPARAPPVVEQPSTHAFVEDDDDDDDEVDDKEDDDDLDAYAVDFVKSKIQRYFAILSQRVGDIVPMAIDMYLVQRFGHDLALRVANATHAFSDAQIADLVRENSDLAKKRHDIQHMLHKLALAREVIDDFGAGGTALFDDTFDDEDDNTLLVED